MQAQLAADLYLRQLPLRQDVSRHIQRGTSVNARIEHFYTQSQSGLYRAAEIHLGGRQKEFGVFKIKSDVGQRDLSARLCLNVHPNGDMKHPNCSAVVHFDSILGVALSV